MQRGITFRLIFRVDGIKAPPIVLPHLIADLGDHQRPEFIGNEAKPRDGFSESISLMMRRADHVGPGQTSEGPGIGCPRKSRTLLFCTSSRPSLSKMA